MAVREQEVQRVRDHQGKPSWNISLVHRWAHGGLLWGEARKCREMFAAEKTLSLLGFCIFVGAFAGATLVAAVLRAGGHEDLAVLLWTAGVIAGAFLAFRTRNWVHIAAYRGKASLLASRIERLPQDLEATDERGRTALFYAVAAGQSGAAELLLEHGAATDVEAACGYRPLHFAAIHGWPGLVRLLLAHQAAPDARDDKGMTALHWAARNGAVRCVGELLRGNADPTARDNKQETALVKAEANGHKSVAELLRLRQQLDGRGT